MVAEVRELAPEERALSKAVKSARYTVRLDTEYFHRATGALAGGWREAVPALRTLALEGDAQGARLSFEVNLDQTEGSTSTPKRVLEALLAIPPEEQASLSVTREATVLA
jgi:hypothetical protein